MREQVKMSSHRQFRGSSLEDLSFRRVCQQLDGTCRRLEKLSEQQSIPEVLAFAKQTIRPYYVYALPAYVRSRIIEKTMEMLLGRGSRCKLATLYLVALLLSHDIKHIKITFCCYYGCRYQSSVLELLASEGIGLESLDMTRSLHLLCFDCKLFHSALLNMKNLSKLVLQRIASDDMLEVIGKTCAKLVILDVAYSKQVTDVGLKQLLLQVEPRDKVTPVSFQQCTKAREWSRLKNEWFNILRKNKNFKLKKRKNQDVLEYHESRNPLCDTLKVLNIAKTGVTCVSVLLTLINIPQLESLLDDNYTNNIAKIIIVFGESLEMFKYDLHLNLDKKNCRYVKKTFNLINPNDHDLQCLCKGTRIRHGMV